MSGDRTADAVFYGLFLLLPLSALFARRLPISNVLKMSLAWLAIFAVGLLLVAQRDRLSGITRLFSDQRVSGTETRVRMASDGHFWADVTMDGVTRRMLIDSGATTTALSVASARAMGLDTEGSPFPAIIGTANGDVMARTAGGACRGGIDRDGRPKCRRFTSVRRDRLVRHEFPVAA